MAHPKIEVVIEMSDGWPSVTLFVDGAEMSDVVEEIIDPGAGHTRWSWDEQTESVRVNTDYSPAFRDHVLQARAEALDSSDGRRYIIDDDL